MQTVEFILYVRDQERSAVFYKKIFGKNPLLDVPGMTEFELGHSVKLGLMPESGIRKILLPHTPDPGSGNGIPRCELYLYVSSPAADLERALEAGAKLIEKESPRDWGDSVAYCADPDGHILAFAKKQNP
ncbi:MAG TPA: VOC family protein [Bacteroidia bacterium]|jgi:predicted enzyme related to lactoylglutathione lyase